MQKAVAFGRIIFDDILPKFQLSHSDLKHVRLVHCLGFATSCVVSMFSSFLVSCLWSKVLDNMQVPPRKFDEWISKTTPFLRGDTFSKASCLVSILVYPFLWTAAGHFGKISCLKEAIFYTIFYLRATALPRPPFHPAIRLLTRSDWTWTDWQSHCCMQRKVFAGHRPFCGAPWQGCLLALHGKMATILGFHSQPWQSQGFSMAGFAQQPSLLQTIWHADWPSLNQSHKSSQMGKKRQVPGHPVQKAEASRWEDDDQPGPPEWEHLASWAAEFWIGDDPREKIE